MHRVRGTTDERPTRPPRPTSSWLHRAVDHAPVGMAVVDADGTVLDANHALERLLGAADLEGTGLEAWFDPDEWVQVHDAVDAAIHAPHASSAFDVRVRMGGDERWAHCNLAPAQDDGWAAVVMLEPVETPSEADERQARSWRREVLHWGDHGDDPVAPLLEGLMALRTGAWGPMGSEARQRIAGLEVHARRLEVLMDEVRCASAIARGTFSVDPQPCDLRAVVHDACSPFREAADDAGIEFRVRAQTPMPCRLDPGRILHVLETLLENALRFTAAGGTVEVEAVPDHGERGGYRITVTDEGPGLDAEQREALWRPFAHVHGDGGVGLGLFVARQTVEAHGGRLEVDSEPGRGATFRFWLPA